MEIEVGKAYRTRHGIHCKVYGEDINKPLNSDGRFLGRLTFPDAGTMDLEYRVDGRFDEDDEGNSDLIAEWSEPVKYRAGDHITLRVTRDVAADLNNGSPAIFSFREADIISHTSAPFDWKDVKPGMAFTDTEDKESLLYWYIGPDLEDAEKVTVMDKPKDFSALDTSFIPKQRLVRAPEHDIEVKS